MIPALPSPPENAIIHKAGFKLLYAGFEMRFAPAPLVLMGAKHIANPDFGSF